MALKILISGLSQDTVGEGGLPAGGSTSQVLVKASAADFDFTWATLSYLPLSGGTLSGNLTFSDTGEGVSFHGSGTITGASGAITITPTSGSNINLSTSGAGFTALAKARVSSSLLFLSGSLLSLASGATAQVDSGATFEFSPGCVVAGLTKFVCVVFDGGGAVPTANTKRYIRVPFNATITKWTILSDISGSAVVDVWKDTYANYPPTVADTIAASAKPTLSSASKNEDSTLTGWSVDIAAGDVLGFNLDSCTTCTVVSVQLELLTG